MHEAAAQRQYKDLHKERPYHDGSFSRFTSEPTAATPFHFEDGVEIFVAAFDANPGDEFLTARNPFDDRASGEED